MKKRRLGDSGLEVSALGLGSMVMSFSYDKTPDRNGILSLLRAGFERHPRAILNSLSV